MIWITYNQTFSHAHEGVYKGTCELFEAGVRWSLFCNGKLVRKGIMRLVATTLDRLLELGQKEVEDVMVKYDELRKRG